LFKKGGIDINPFKSDFVNEINLRVDNNDLRIKVERLKLLIAQKNNDQDAINTLSVAIATDDYQSSFVENFWGRRSCMCGPAMCPWGRPVIIELNEGDEIEVGDPSLIMLEPDNSGANRVYLNPATEETDDIQTTILINGQSLDVIVNDHEIKIPLN
jgi:hypothetical protein